MSLPSHVVPWPGYPLEIGGRDDAIAYLCKQIDQRKAENELPSENINEIII